MNRGHFGKRKETICNFLQILIQRGLAPTTGRTYLPDPPAGTPLQGANGGTRNRMAGSTSSKTQLDELGLKASKEYSSDIYIYAGQIDEKGYEALRREVLLARRSDNVLLILITTGGSGSAAFKIARLFQTFYDKFDIYIPAECKAAGTVLALGANRIWMSPFSELGPIDGQVPRSSARASVEEIMRASFQFFEFSVTKLIEGGQGTVGFKQAAETGGTMAANMMTSLFAKVDPELLGRNNRLTQEAIGYGSRLAATSGNADQDTVVSLAEDYPCHDFVIDFRQAKTLFRNVQQAGGTLFAVGNDIHGAIHEGSELTAVIRTLHSTSLPETPDPFEPFFGEVPNCSEMANVANYSDWFAGRHQAREVQPDWTDELSQKAA